MVTPKYNGHLADVAHNGKDVSDHSSGGDHDRVTSDTTTLPSDGTLAPKGTCYEGSDSLATTSMVKSETDDRAPGSDSGVDDHAIKLPAVKESTV